MIIITKITNINRKYLAINIVKLRKQKKLSQEQLAYDAKTTSKCISDLELGKRNVKIDTMSKVADALGVTLSDLTKPTK